MKFFYLFLFLISAGIINAQNTANLAQATAFAAQQKAAFEENKGQVWDTEGKMAPEVKYHFKKKGIDIFMLPKGLAYQFTKVHYPEGYNTNLKKGLSQEEYNHQKALRAQIRTETYRMDMELVDANPNAKIIAEGESEDYVQYYNRNALDVQSFTKLTYQDVYPGIDWVIYTTETGLKYDFVVQAGANPALIQLKFKHHEDLKINADGSFTLSNSIGTVTEQAPISFQGEQDIQTAFKLEGDIISFDLSNYDKNKLITIDPSLLWATYYGGQHDDEITNCVVDETGYLYLAGSTASTSNIASGGHQNTLSGGTDAFFVKFSATGVRQFATYYGGIDDETEVSVAVDTSGNIYLAGTTLSTSNIALNGHSNTNAGRDDVFLVKFNSTGIRQWATYYGGSQNERGGSCAVDKAGNVYLVGSTNSSQGIAFNGHQNTYSSFAYYVAFLVKFDSNGIRQWATYYDPSSEWMVTNNCVVDETGNVYIIGDVAFSYPYFRAFFVKFNPSGVLQWQKFHSGGDYSVGMDCAIDLSGNVYFVGTEEEEFPTTDLNAFVSKYDSVGVLIWNLTYAGANFDYGTSCVLDAADNLYLTGTTYSTSNIASNGYQNTHGGASDAFLVKFNSSGIRQWATYYGGSANDAGNASALDGLGNIYLAGTTSSTSNIASGGHQNTLTGNTEGFVVKFNDPTTCLTTSGIDSLTACNSYTWIDGITYTTSNNSAMDTLMNIAGCDSIVTLNLTILNSATGTDNQTACNSYTWIDGMTYTTSNNSATDTLTAANGCDSIVTLNLIINNSNTGTDTQTACDSYTWIDGMTYTTSNNSATFTLTNVNGCDSIITLDLTINNSNSGTDTQTACNSYTWMDGNTYTTNNNAATFTLTNVNGCDSVITLDLTINTIDTTTSIAGTTITATTTGATYQWVDCATGFSPINNATGQSFTPSQNGDYAVVISQNGCVDTSSCSTIIVVGLNDLATNNNITIYPNPTTENIHIDFGKLEQEVSLKLYSTDGKLIQSNTQIQGSLYQLKLPKTTGIYILEVNTEQGISHYKIIKE